VGYDVFSYYPIAGGACTQTLYTLQERYNAMEAKKAFVKAMACFKRDCPSVIGKDKKADFHEIDAGMNAELKEEMIRRSGGGKTFPQIFVDDTHIGGCDDMMALDRAGKLDPLLAGA
jgi:glutaredoxin 3